MRRGEIVTVSLDPVLGSEAAKTRPAVVVSNDAAKEIFGSWDSPLPYIRIVPQPS